MSRLEKIIFALTFVVLVLGGVWVANGLGTFRAETVGVPAATSAGGSQPSSAAYQQAKQAQNPNDPCVPPPGYTEESWREHMGHHPDEYRQCLGR